MQHSEETFLSNKARRMLVLFCALILFYLVAYLLDPYAEFWKNYLQRSFLDISIEWFVTFLFCFLVAEGTLVIHHKLNKTIPWTLRPGMRFLTETFLNIIVVLLLNAMSVLCIYLIYNKSDAIPKEFSIDDIRGMLQWIIVSFAITFIIMAVNTGSFMVNKWKNSELEVTEQKLRVSELRQASVEAELNALKLQLDPHFIFNNLSVLSELILVDQNLGYTYSENFAKVYRFLLLSSKKNLVPLEEEMRFLRSYIFLTEHRIGNGVHFSIDVAEKANKLLIPPLTLQLLIENAIKHNATTKDNPLEIKIYTDTEQNVIIENNVLALKHAIKDSTGLGLANIIRRFSLLSHKVPDIIYKHNIFKVVIHLIAYDQ